MEGSLTGHHHAVQFYDSDDSLFSTVAGFLSEGLVSGQPCVVIATEPHQAGILAHLASRLVDVERARHDGDLVVLDAQELLDMFVVDDMPNPALFEKHVGSLIEQIRGGRKRMVVRAYGEMVDILWKDGRQEAALALELLWNKLAARRSFALLCGYAMGHFYKRSEDMQQVCAQHSEVISTGRKVLPFKARRLRTG